MWKKCFHTYQLFRWNHIAESKWQWASEDGKQYSKQVINMWLKNTNNKSINKSGNKFKNKSKNKSKTGAKRGQVIIIHVKDIKYLRGKFNNKKNEMKVEPVSW